MNYLSAEKLTKVYGAKTLFQDISFGLDAGEKKALIAKNGAGKSTLMQILVGRETADKGRVVLRSGVRLTRWVSTSSGSAWISRSRVR